MSVTENGTTGLPTNAPVVTKEWAPGIGETETREWTLGTPDNILAEYETLKAAAEAGNNTQAIAYRNAEGRATLVAKFGRQSNINVGYGADVTVIEELYSIDVIKDIAESAYYNDIGSKEIAWVRYCVENRLDDTEITAEAARLGKSAATFAWANWTDDMKSLRYHMVRGVEAYFETGFILRRSLYGVNTSFIQASFSGINEVGSDPTVTTNMAALLGSLPDGEWLYRPPQAEHLGKGKWRITLEWQWSLKWSIMYGGTFNGTT